VAAKLGYITERRVRWMESKSSSKKKVYSTPKVTVYGNVERITQGNQSGDYTDQAFPVKTAFKDLTFSN
jgi:hypothetical protein